MAIRQPYKKMNFSDYCAAMVGCYSAMPEEERATLGAWEYEYVDGSGTYGTSDWPGWEKYIGKWDPTPYAGPDRKGFVYLLQTQSGLCKIGWTKSVMSRVRQLQCGNPEPLLLLHHFRSENAQRDERKLHRLFAYKLVRNEWFALTDQDIENVRSIGLDGNG